MVNHREIKKTLIHVFQKKTLTNDEFNDLCISIFKFQYQNNNIYQSYVNHVCKNVTNIHHYTQIPFLPIEFFKKHDVVCLPPSNSDVVFTSSGTTGSITSKHIVQDIELYSESYRNGFQLFYGSIYDYCILALLPSYLERSGSSLIYMFHDLIKESNHPLSAFYLHNIDELVSTTKKLAESNQKVLLLGVTYALLDLAEKKHKLAKEWIVMETGGMKGKRKEMIKHELHEILINSFGVNSIHSEYGMTELLSQAYSKKNGIYHCVPWMKILIRDVNDPFTYLNNHKTGGINVIDLANLYSCSFIETKDLGKINEDGGFEIMGRFDNSDLRGCNLMIN